MKKIFTTLALLLLSTSVLAWTIGPMNYQGRLLDNAGIPVTGSYNFKVRIYDALSGGTLKFSEDQNSIAVADGVYSFLVSTGTNPSGTWDINLWNTPSLYLEIEVNGEILSPRHLMASTPFAFQANLALTTNNALALGGKSATEYNNTLAAICVSGKGKWLELVGKCLGVGAQFPGPTLVLWSTLTGSNDFRNLDLSRANISGIDFNGANLNGSVFIQTTYSVASITSADLSNTVWDGAVSTDTISAGFAQSGSLSGATLTNMDLSKWSMFVLLQGNLTNFSAANLTACPNSSPTQWTCRLMYPAGSTYFLLGPGVNLSATSAASVRNQGVSYLNLDKSALNNFSLSYVSFVGNVVNQDFINSNLNVVDFSKATITDATFQSSSITSVLFVGAKLNKVAITNAASNLNFTGAELNEVDFKATISTTNFTRAALRNTRFRQSVVGSNFTSAVLDNVTIDGQANNSIFDQTRFYNGFMLNSFVAGAASTNVTFKDLSFFGGKVSGNFDSAVFTGTTTFRNIFFDKVRLSYATIPLWDITAPHDDLVSVSWGSQIFCPDGQLVTDGCDSGDRMGQ